LAAARQESGGIRSRLDFVNDAARATLAGPANEALVNGKPATVNFDIYRDVQAGAVLIELQKQRCLIGKGQWSDWMRLDFAQSMPSFLPDSHLHGICRFYLQEVVPSLRLYVTPINMDPTQPAVPLSTPPEFVQQIAGELGLFYTTGFQEDYNARSNKVFTDDEYAEQANIVLDERRRLFRYALDHFTEGVLFFYFSSTDLQAHIFWWDGDEKHPFRSPEEARKGQTIIKALYRKMDEVVGEAQAKLGRDTTLLVMSDHGFANFRRQFNLNTWLREHGYLYPTTCTDLLQNADWSKTRAYGLGLNGLYLNLQGREREGIVIPGLQREALLTELVAQLEAVRDADGQPVIKKVYRADQIYTGPNLKYAPDLIIGYHRGYRASWATTLGQITPSILSDNDSAWSADHCMVADEVPGVLFSTRALASATPSLIDLAPTILSEYGVSIPSEMTGQTVFAAGSGRKSP
jgi:predicted AlkP superfamily phosphohydrolase/phosphomutase